MKALAGTIPKQYKGEESNANPETVHCQPEWRQHSTRVQNLSI
jgi:hypothetical protein